MNSDIEKNPTNDSSLFKMTPVLTFNSLYNYYKLNASQGR